MFEQEMQNEVRGKQYLVVVLGPCWAAWDEDLVLHQVATRKKKHSPINQF